MTESILKKLQRLVKSLEEERSSYEPHWIDIRDHFCPDSADALDGTESNANDGRKRMQKILDLIVLEVVDTLAAGMIGGMVSPVKQWLSLEIEGMDSLSVESSQWLDIVVRIMLKFFKKNDYYNSSHSFIRDDGLYGTGAMLVEEGDQAIDFLHVPIGEFYLDDNSRGEVDTFARKVAMTAREIAQEYGAENLTESMQKLYEDSDRATRFNVWHIIMPRQDADESIEGKVKKNTEMPWASYHYLEAEEGKKDTDKLLRESGYHEQPFSCPRWEKYGSRVYGVGCGWKALPAAKQLREETAEKLLNLAMNVKPPLNAPGSQNKLLSLAPGAINSVSGTGKDTITPTHVPNLSLAELRADIEDLRNQIRNAFYFKTFVALRDIEKQMTALEARQRLREQLTLLSPFLTKLAQEGIEPIVARTYGILSRNGAFPPPPEEIAGQPVKIVFLGELAKAQQADELAPLQEGIEIAGSLAAAWPDVMDNINFDKILRHAFDAVGVPATVLNDEETIAALRQQRQQMQAAQRADAQAMQGVSALKELGGANLDGTALGAVADAVTQ